MLKEERQQYIINHINNNYRIYITELSEELNVSDDTLRRDLNELDKQGLLTKVHGGAVAKSGIPVEFIERLKRDTTIKRQIVAKSIPLIKDNEVLLIDGGTYNLEFASQLPNNIKLTVYTNSFPIANILMDRPNTDLIFLGGKVFPSSQVTIGISVYHALQTVRPDWLILGISNIHPQQGLTAPDREEAMIKRFMLERAKKCMVFVDHQKLNTADTYAVASLGDIDYLITEDSRIEYLKDNWPKYHYTIL